MNTAARVSTEFGALDAFFPGELALSGDIDRARRLEESCYKMWTRFGIEPEEIDYSKMKISYDGYALRPEIIESAYYLYHFTNAPGTLRWATRFSKVSRNIAEPTLRTLPCAMSRPRKRRMRWKASFWPRP